MVVLFCAPDEIYSCPQFGVVDFARCGTIRFTLGVELSSEGWGYSVFRAWGRRSTASQHGGCALLSRPTHGPQGWRDGVDPLDRPAGARTAGRSN